MEGVCHCFKIFNDPQFTDRTFFSLDTKPHFHTDVGRLVNQGQMTGRKASLELNCCHPQNRCFIDEDGNKEAVVEES